MAFLGALSAALRAFGVGVEEVYFWLIWDRSNQSMIVANNEPLGEFQNPTSPLGTPLGEPRENPRENPGKSPGNTPGRALTKN